MTLSDYMNQNDINAYSLAEMLDVSYQSVYRWINGEDIPRKENAKKIADLTSGMVTPNDFVLTEDFKTLPQEVNKCQEKDCGGVCDE